MTKPILITMGDPAGIGPEIILKSFQESRVYDLPLIVLGDFKLLHELKEDLRINSFALKVIETPQEAHFGRDYLHIIDFNNIDFSLYSIGKASALCGQAAFDYIMASIDFISTQQARAVVTAPINKAALHKAGHFYPGHTEIYAQSCNTEDFAMHLYDEKLSIIHVSTHISLEDAVTKLSKERVQKVIQIAHDNMVKIIGRKPKIAVAGLNPHSGEGGLFGQQEIQIIAPAIEAMAGTIDVTGPIAPDTVFYRGLQGEFDIVVAMYHDQGHIPFKIYAFDSGVNISAGLPIMRTSVDHGTAFNIAGQNKADCNSMVNAIMLADKLTN